MAGGAFHRAMSRAMVSTTADAKWTYHHMSGVPRSDPSRKVTAKQPLIAWLGTPGTISFNWSKAAWLRACFGRFSGASSDSRGTRP